MMDAVAIGPFVLPLDRLFTLLALAGFLSMAELMARRMRLPGWPAWAWNAVVAGLLAARLGYVVGHWVVFRKQPLSIAYVWQGGFDPVWGMLGGVVYTLALFRGRIQALRPAVWPALSGAAVALALFGLAGVKAPQQAELPDLTLPTLAGATRNLSEYKGRPVVLNVWATWCPPCRREMPMLAEAEAEHPGAAFVFVNAGERAEQVQAFLDGQGLFFNHVLLDPGQRLVPRLNIIGYPTTFFFDSQGMMFARKTGELSRAALEDLLARLR